MKYEVERVVYTVEEAAQALGISRGLAYQMAKDGSLPILRLGKRIVVPKVSLEKMLASAESKS